jgi:molecular chaperone DnaK
MSLKSYLGRGALKNGPPCLGIDLGTTNTSAAYGMQALDLTANPEGGVLLPSVVAFSPTGATLVGSPALRRRIIDPENTIYSSKRVIGRSFSSSEAREFRHRYPFRAREAADGGMEFVTRAGAFTPVDIAARLVTAVCRDVPVDPWVVPTVITVPATFQAPQRQATAEAAQRAGLKHVSVVEEPHATALAYAARLGKVSTAAVYDLGGGTFDFALLDCGKDPFEMIAHDGDPFLGGNDVDYALAQWAAEEILKEHNWDARRDPEAFDRLTLECERAKIRLSYAAETTLDLGQVEPVLLPAGTKLTVDIPRLESLTRDLLQRTFVICDAVLRRAGRTADTVDCVFLAGGSTLLPMVREGLQRFFGKAPRDEITPVEVVSIGASLAAQTRAS